MTHTNPHTSNRRRAARLAAVAGLAVLTATGCLKVDMDLSVQDELVDGTIVIAMDSQTARMFELTAEDVVADIGDDDFATLDGVTAGEYEDDDWIGAEYRFDGVSIDDLNALAAGDDEMPRIVHDPDQGTYEFLMSMDMRDFADDGAADPEFGFDPTAMMESFEVRVSITFPGEVTDHNGTRDGTTVTWAPEPGELLEMRAVAADSGGGLGSTAVIALAVALGVLVLVAGGGVVLWRARRGPAPAAGQETGSTEAAPPQQ